MDLNELLLNELGIRQRLNDLRKINNHSKIMRQQKKSDFQQSLNKNQDNDTNLNYKTIFNTEKELLNFAYKFARNIKSKNSFAIKQAQYYQDAFLNALKQYQSLTNKLKTESKLYEIKNPKIDNTKLKYFKEIYKLMKNARPGDSKVSNTILNYIEEIKKNKNIQQNTQNNNTQDKNTQDNNTQDNTGKYKVLNKEEWETFTRLLNKIINKNNGNFSNEIDEDIENILKKYINNVDAIKNSIYWTASFARKEDEELIDNVKDIFNKYINKEI